VVPEALEGSLMLASHALVMLGVPLRRVVHRVQARATNAMRRCAATSTAPAIAGDDIRRGKVRLDSEVLPTWWCCAAPPNTACRQIRCGGAARLGGGGDLRRRPPAQLIILRGG
jgi:hypothetical protein